jgi:hypothetical protein
VSRAQAQGICGDEVTAGGWVVTGETTSNFGLNGGVQEAQGRALLQGELDFVHAETGCHVFGPLIAYGEPTLEEAEELGLCFGEDCRRLEYDVTIQLISGETFDGTAIVVVCDNGEPGTLDTFSIAVFEGEIEVDEEPLADCSVRCTNLVGGNVQLHVYGNCD